MIDDIICYKLITGEEVIGSRVEGKQHTLKNVAAVMMVPSNQNAGQIGLGLMPFLPYSEDEVFTFNSNSVIVEFKPNIDLINNYNRIFGAGIQIASHIQ
jgi:hypothetical protein